MVGCPRLDLRTTVGPVSTSEITTDQFVAWLEGFAELVATNQAHLTQLDSAIGDADHGSNMVRGTAAVRDVLSVDATLGALAKKVGMTLVGQVGGASGPLFGTFFLKLASVLGDSRQCDASDLAKALRAAAEGVAARGKSRTGEKTMLDALFPACEAFETSLAGRDSLPEALQQAAEAADQGARATTDMVATKGRASYLGERSRGHQDPGATSAGYLFEALAASAEHP